ncbi:cytochrome b5 domain-containing protein [Brevibacillus massiliensis]|uniref:cytochrome b5 domain-containing protein n=1 Tax=Brevibacillus massiliensis TaxID=1118054 RepID=UPI000361DF94|nr:cytochrome b5 domain-containing protein [Brevibacillus massiliensis]
MNQREYLLRQAELIFSELNYLIRLLYHTEDYYQKNLLLNQVWNKISQLQFIHQLIVYHLPPIPALVPAPPVPTVPIQPMQPEIPRAIPPNVFTRDQLARFNGKNGNPAYVAVNGMVYDVTNHKGWSAATHFGLTAGKDLTKEFASCHAGQQWILGTLIPVGRLV